MENPKLKSALSDVTQALDRVNRAFEAHLEQLKHDEGDPAKVKLAAEAVRSLRDSSAMYLAWAHHYAGVPQPDEPVPS